MTTTSDYRVISYLSLRKAIGLLGILLPVVLAFGYLLLGCLGIQPSISDYYHTPLRDLFVGIIAAVALFLFAYRGYPEDRFPTKLASICALGVAFFPTGFALTPNDGCILTPQLTQPAWISILHFSFATLFFISLIYISFHLFTKSSEASPPIEKRRRNAIFRICGWIMLISICLIAVYAFFIEDRYPAVSRYDPIFWLEAISLWAFGLAWLTKGQFILADSAEQSVARDESRNPDFDHYLA